MKPSALPCRLLPVLLSALFATFAAPAASAAPSPAEPVGTVLAQARQHQAPLLDTLKDLCNIESGSRDPEGLDKISGLIAQRLEALGGEVRLIDGNTDVYPMEDTPARLGKQVQATFRGSGAKKILLIAHMDTVYLKGMLARQPFRIDGGKAYGLGIADDKQGVALILHTVAMLKELGFKDYGTLTVLINSDEEIGSPGSRKLISRLGAEHDATLSFEPSRSNLDKISLATAGIAGVFLNVQGKASHAGNAPEAGVNALYEMAHQVSQMRDLSAPDGSVKLNWTLAKAGSNRNVIPEQAQAQADVRVLKVEDYDAIEKKVRERAARQLLPQAKVDVVFERRRPPLEATPASQALARHAQAVYRELGRELVVDPVAEGGGTDAAFAALQTRNAVVERFGVQGFGAHSSSDEYILVDSIVPRLYLGTRLIMDVARGKM